MGVEDACARETRVATKAYDLWIATGNPDAKYNWYRAVRHTGLHVPRVQPPAVFFVNPATVACSCHAVRRPNITGSRRVKRWRGSLPLVTRRPLGLGKTHRHGAVGTAAVTFSLQRVRTFRLIESVTLHHVFRHACSLSAHRTPTCLQRRQLLLPNSAWTGPKPRWMPHVQL
jgi:hypothetical protein